MKICENAPFERWLAVRDDGVSCFVRSPRWFSARAQASRRLRCSQERISLALHSESPEEKARKIYAERLRVQTDFWWRAEDGETERAMRGGVGYEGAALRQKTIARLFGGGME